MKCELCDDINVGPEHEISEKHLKNRTLYDYAKHRKSLAGNRKGIEVTCSVKSCSTTVVDCTDAKVKVSTKPKEQVKFIFKVRNDCKTEDVILVSVQMLFSGLNFVMNNGVAVGDDPLLIRPKRTLQKEIFVVFNSNDIGQYEMPVTFSFRKPATKEGVIVMRDMVVFVEEQTVMHEKKISPFALKTIYAEKIYGSYLKSDSGDMFLIPKGYKPIYARCLKEKEDASFQENELCKDIKETIAAGVTQENYVRFFHHLLWYEETIVRVNLKRYNMSNVPLLPNGKDCFGLFVPTLAEKRPSLLVGDIIYVKPHENDKVMFEGVINDFGGDSMVFIRGFHREFYKYYSEKCTFDIRFFMSRMSLERMHQAVNAVVQDGSEQARVFPQEIAKLREVKTIDNYYNPLVENNAEQRVVVEHILSGTSGLAPYLVHGPPGTGKTVTIVEAILQLVNKNKNNRIMVCTDSNMAADNVGVMLIKFIHLISGEKLLLRANSRFRVWETLPQSLRPYSNGHSRDNFKTISISEFLDYNIVITTLSHAAKFAKDLKTRGLRRPITHLFIDEAAQASEPASLIPICGLLSPSGSLVLAGDPLQLGPVIISHHVRRLGLGLSLMERLKNNFPMYSDERSDPNYIVLLRDNYRSNVEILQIPNQLFYKGQLRPCAVDDDISYKDILDKNKKSQAILFHGVLSKEQRQGKSPSYSNDMELEIVEKYVIALVRDHKVAPEDIGIVTPYIRQVYNIKNWLNSQTFGGDRIEVGTVEAFQGKEKRVIIVSTVRANCDLLGHDAKFQLGFLVDDKRFNVALTRAKAKAIIIGNPLCLQKDVKWKMYMQKCRELGTYHGYNSEKTKIETIQKDILKHITPLLKDMDIKSKA